MAYLKNENGEIIVDAILTKYGRDRLAKRGQLNITKFSLSDDEIDYSLYNTNHKAGTEYYDIAIRELPVLEALPGNSVAMKYHLFTNTDGSISTVTSLSATFDSVLTRGITKTNTKYSITPILTPQPSNLNSIYYIMEVPMRNDGINLEPKRVIDPDIGLTQQIKDADRYIYIDPKTSEVTRYEVGHSFTIKLTARPLKGRTYPIKITAYGPVNTNTYTIKVYVPGTDDTNV